MLQNNSGSFYFDNDEIEIELIKLKQIILLEDNPITEKSKTKIESKQIQKEQKSKVKKKINECDDLIKQCKNDLVIKKRQNDKYSDKYNELKYCINSDKQKLKLKNKINEYDDLIKQYKNDLVIKKRQNDKYNDKYNELKNNFNSEKQK